MKNIFSISNITIGIAVVLATILLNQFMYVLPIHIGAFILTITAVIIADLHALLWARGKLPLLESRRLQMLHNAVSTGLLVSITSGFIMFLPLREYLVTVEAFWVKLAFVLVLIINSFVIARHMHVPTSRTFTSLTKQERRPLLISGAVSTISWIIVFASALLLNV
jgi:hypothetical protein